jgi:plasmid replication initiation protein
MVNDFSLLKFDSLNINEKRIILSILQENDFYFDENIHNRYKVIRKANDSKYKNTDYFLDSIKNLCTKKLTFFNGVLQVTLPWIASIIQSNDDEFIEFTMDDIVKKHMMFLKKIYTKNNINSLLDMKNSHTLAIYELIEANLNKRQPSFKIALEDLKVLLNIGVKYKKYNDFKRFVLVKCKDQLFKLAGIVFDFTELKNGLKVTELLFNITKVNKYNYI